MIDCPSCGAENIPGVDECSECGQPLIRDGLAEILKHFEPMLAARKKDLQEAIDYDAAQPDDEARGRVDVVAHRKYLVAKRQGWVDAIKEAIALRDLQPGPPPGAAE